MPWRRRGLPGAGGSGDDRAKAAPEQDQDHQGCPSAGDVAGLDNPPQNAPPSILLPPRNRSMAAAGAAASAAVVALAAAGPAPLPEQLWPPPRLSQTVPSRRGAYLDEQEPPWWEKQLAPADPDVGYNIYSTYTVLDKDFVGNAGSISAGSPGDGPFQLETRVGSGPETLASGDGEFGMRMNV